MSNSDKIDSFASTLPKNIATELNSQGQGFIMLDSKDQLEEITRGLKVIKEWDTNTSGVIKFYQNDSNGTEGAVLVEEEHMDTHKPVLRILNASDIDSFIEDRRVAYSTIWGSCCGGDVEYLCRFKRATS